MKVEIWSDVVCPWCYLGKRQFETALAGFDHAAEVEVVYRSFELDPRAPADVTTPTVELLSSKYGMSLADAEGAQRQMTARAAEIGLDFRMDGLRSGNTRSAHRLLHLAKDHGLQPALAERLHRAYFTDQQSIFDNESLIALATEVGLSQADVTRVLTSDEYDDAVAEDEATASELGATGVPFFVIDRRYAIPGAQSTETVLAVLNKAWSNQVES